MSTVVIANPILNSPFVEPDRHFHFDDDGITNEVIERRRVSSYFVPVPASRKRKGAGQLALDTERTQDRIEKNVLVNQIRGRINLWRQGGYQGVTNTTRRLLEHWIDTDYNEESFFVRHAYFTGADEPYKRLQRALRAEIDEDAWASLYRTESRPFDRPETGKIAVKAINHYGDEVMKVFEV